MEVTWVCSTVRSTAGTAANSPEIRTAPPITRFARTPRIRAVRKSIAAARMCSPTDVRESRSCSKARQTAAVATAMIAIFRTKTPPMSHGAWSCASAPAVLPSDPKASRAMLWRRNATAKVATSITAGECVRNGRKTSLSISTDSASTTPKQKRIESQFGRPH